MMRKKVSLRQEWPLLLWLVIMWAALWRDFSPGNLIIGVIVAVAVTRVFYLPPVELSGRFNLWYFFLFILIFIGRVIVASLQVTWVILVRGRKVCNAVVAVPLHSKADLQITLTGHLVSLVPGSLIIEVDRSEATLYLHALDVADKAQADQVRASVRSAESWLIRIMGSKEEFRALKEGRLRWQIKARAVSSQPAVPAVPADFCETTDAPQSTAAPQVGEGSDGQ